MREGADLRHAQDVHGSARDLSVNEPPEQCDATGKENQDQRNGELWMDLHVKHIAMLLKVVSWHYTLLCLCGRIFGSSAEITTQV
jgi:hypothetical protein